jgi:hypothetical protein
MFNQEMQLTGPASWLWPVAVSLACRRLNWALPAQGVQQTGCKMTAQDKAILVSLDNESFPSRRPSNYA